MNISTTGPIRTWMADRNHQFTVFSDGRGGELPPEIRTRHGHRFNYLAPDPSSIVIEDIAHALGAEPRFGGHTPFPYSVAQHSVYVFRQVPAALGATVALQALLHDAPEAYLKDIPRPLKQLLPEYGHIEALVWVAVCERFGLPTELHPAVKRADRDLGDFEMEAFRRPGQTTIPRVHPEMARKCFLDCYWRLTDPGYKNGRAPLHLSYM